NKCTWDGYLSSIDLFGNTIDVCTRLLLFLCTARCLVYANCRGLGNGQEPWTRSPASAAAVVSASTSVRKVAWKRLIMLLRPTVRQISINCSFEKCRFSWS